MASILRGSASRPTTSWPSSAKATASGSPTYPSPTTPTFMRPSVGSGLPGAGGRVAELPPADDVVHVEPARRRGVGRGFEAACGDRGQVADHGGRIHAEQLLEAAHVIGLHTQRDPLAGAVDLADR